jgi:ATP-dependent Clp protease ATP-binding subunit ClpA
MLLPPPLFEKALRLSVRGQDHIAAPVAAALRVAAKDLCETGKPKHSFLFLGPTGVGKTETARTVAELVYGDKDALMTFDMGAFQTEEMVPEFTSSFFNRLSARPEGAVILLDEIEKGHASITTLLLAILDEGRFTAREGTLHLDKYFLIFTSNLGCKAIIGMSESDISTIKRFAIAEAENYFRPEVVARFNTVEVFGLLSLPIQKEICIKFLESYLKLVEQRHFLKITYKPNVVTFLINKGMDNRLGARPLKNAVRRYVGDAIADSIDFLSGQTGSLTVEASNTKLKLTEPTN